MAGFLDMRGQVISKTVRPGQSDLLEVALYYGPAPWQPTGAELRILASTLNNALGREEDTVPLGLEFMVSFEQIKATATAVSGNRPPTRVCPACDGRIRVGDCKMCGGTGKVPA